MGGGEVPSLRAGRARSRIIDLLLVVGPSQRMDGVPKKATAFTVALSIANAAAVKVGLAIFNYQLMVENDSNLH